MHLKRLGYVENTCRTRQLNVDEFLHYLEERGRLNIEEVGTDEVLAFYDYVSERPNKSRAGILSKKRTFEVMKSIDHLYRMLQSGGEVKINPLSTLKFSYPKEELPKRDILTQAEIMELYEVSISGWERSILSLGYGCGLRVGELDHVKIEDVRLRERILIVPKGKGNKRRVIPMSEGVVNDLSDYYFKERGHTNNGRIKDEDAFMLNSKGRRLREWTCNSTLKKLIGRTGNAEIQCKHITMHSLRHSIATHLIERGIPVGQVRQFLGHSQLETTQIYTHISKQQLEKLMDEPE